MKVLIVGQGAREHALAWKLAASEEVEQVLSAPGNPGTARLGRNLAVGATDVAGLVAAAKEHEVDLVVVGPEAPLALGLVDALTAEGLLAYGPSRAAAQLEASKSFSKDFMKRHGIPTADYEVFEDAAEAARSVKARGEARVVKADGLAAGKGVVVPADVEGTLAAIDSIMVRRDHGQAGARVVLEEVLSGPEISYHVVSDGQRYVALAAAQDHKRLRDGDGGPNTGGMGAYSPPPMVDEAMERAIRERVVEPTLRGMAAQGTPLRGTLFVGLMLVGSEPRVLEFNVRFGDPETEVLMARLGQDVLPLLLGSARGDLGELADRELTWGAPSAVCVVMASEGYPGAVDKGRAIEGVEEADALEAVTVFHAGTRAEQGRLLTDGGRVLCVTATGDDVDAAAARAYAGVDRIRFDGAQVRRDIGGQARRA